MTLGLRRPLAGERETVTRRGTSFSGSTPMAITVTIACVLGIIFAIGVYGKNNSPSDPFDGVENASSGSNQAASKSEKSKPSDNPNPVVESTSPSERVAGKSDPTNEVKEKQEISARTGSKRTDQVASQSKNDATKIATLPKEKLKSVIRSPKSTQTNTTASISKTDERTKQTQTDNAASKKTVKSQKKNAAKAPTFSGPKTKPPMPKFSSDFVKNAYIKQFRELLNEGWLRGSRGMDAATKRFEAARSLHANDPRLYHAYGLVLCKHDRHAEAVEQFEAACKSVTFPYLPAWKAIAWCHAKTNRADKSLTALEQLAQQIERSTAAWPDDFAKYDTSKWIGRMAGYWRGPADFSSDNADLLQQKIAAIFDTLDEVRIDAAKAGVAAVLRQHGELKTQDSNSKDSKLNALNTYLPFNLEEHKKLLVDTYPN